MTEAFKLKDLGEKLKAKGLPIAEEAVEQVYEATKEWLLDSGKIKGGLYEAGINLVVGAVDEVAKAAINKIDGDPAT